MKHPANEARQLLIDAQNWRPTNFARNVYHVTNAIGVLLLVQYLLTTDALRIGVAAVACCAAWSMELSRRLSPQINALLMRLFAKVAHPDEAHHINSATWYATAILLLALFSPLYAGMVGLAVLGLGDPAAAIVGRRFGRHVLPGGRTFEGSAAFVAAGALAAWLALVLWHPAIENKLLLALAASLGGAIAEIASAFKVDTAAKSALIEKIRIDDNLVIPIAAAAVTAALHWAMGSGQT